MTGVWNYVLKCEDKNNGTLVLQNCELSVERFGRFYAPNDSIILFYCSRLTTKMVYGYIFAFVSGFERYIHSIIYFIAATTISIKLLHLCFHKGAIYIAIVFLFILRGQTL